MLNLGHTFGHALELIGNYKDYNHGEAVALGILSASKLSQMTENLPKSPDNSFTSPPGVERLAMVRRAHFVWLRRAVRALSRGYSVVRG